MASNNFALGTKIRAMYGKMVTDEQFLAFAQSKTQEQALVLLRATPSYQSLEPTHNLAVLEETLQELRRERVRSLLYYANATERSFLEAYQYEEELSQLKDYLRVLLFTDRSSVFDFVEHSSYRDELHFSADLSIDLSVYLQQLFDRPYARVLEPYLFDSLESIQKRYHTLEWNLDRWFYANLQDALKKLPNTAQKEIEAFVGMKIDLLNLQWLYRVKTFHPEDAFFLQTAMPVGGKQLKPALLKELYKMDRKQFLSWLQNTKYADLVVNEESRDYEWDIRANRKRKRQLELLFRKTRSALVGAALFIELTEFEVVNLIRILEGLHLNLKPETLIEYLIIEDEKGGRM